MLRGRDGKKRTTHGRETRARKGPHRAPSAEGCTPPGRQGAQDGRQDRCRRRSRYRPYQARPPAACRLAARRVATTHTKDTKDTNYRATKSARDGTFVLFVAFVAVLRGSI